MLYNKHYPRSTRNFYYCKDDAVGIKVWYSYVTAVAIEIHGMQYVCQNVWSVTTGKHLSWIDGGSKEAKARRVPYPMFEKLLLDHAIDKQNHYQTYYMSPTSDVSRTNVDAYWGAL